MSINCTKFDEVLFCDYRVVKYLDEKTINGRAVIITASVDTNTEIKGKSRVSYNLFIKLFPSSNNGWTVEVSQVKPSKRISCKFLSLVEAKDYITALKDNINLNLRLAVLIDSAVNVPLVREIPLSDLK